MRNEAVFILTHKRPDRVYTHKLLREHGYSGRIYLLVDDLDPTIKQYQDTYGEENVIVFSKEEVEKKFDIACTSKNYCSIFFARNACWQIAEDLGIEYFVELDDDYTSFCFRVDHHGKFLTKAYHINDLDRVFESYYQFLDSSPLIKTVAFAQTGDFIGGENNALYKKGVLRKAMNAFFCDTKKPFPFLGRVNEDVNTYTSLGSRGDLFITPSPVVLQQKATQSNAGGLTDMYLDQGTYVKSAYSVLFSPSCVTIKPMGAKHKRLHHSIAWNYAIPKMLREHHKKHEPENEDEGETEAES